MLYKALTMKLSGRTPAADRSRPSWLALAAAAVAIGGAVVAAVAGSRDATPLYRVLAGTVTAGDTVITGNDGARLALADGSRLAMRPFSGLSIERRHEGLVVRLKQGGIIASAAPQGTRDLRIETKDKTFTVVGTIAVTTGTEGSRTWPCGSRDASEAERFTLELPISMFCVDR